MTGHVTIERVSGAPAYLVTGRWIGTDGRPFETISRRKLDTRQVVPFFERDGKIFAGVLERARSSRALRSASLVGWEPVGIDFGGVDETGDILEYGRAIFADHAKVVIDPNALKIPLPSLALSIGYLTELALPLLVHVAPPSEDVHEVSWDGLTHHIRFLDVNDALSAISKGEPQGVSELLVLMLRALVDVDPPPPLHRQKTRQRGGGEREAREKVNAGTPGETAGIQRFSFPLSAASFGGAPPLGGVVVEGAGGEVSPATRADDPTGEQLRFLTLSRVTSDEAGVADVVTPGSGVTVALMPVVSRDGVDHVILWSEVRVAALERRFRQPLFDLPVPTRFLNATGCYVDAEDAAVVATSDPAALAAMASRMLSRVLGRDVRVDEARPLGPALEPAPAVSSEIRHRVVCRLDVSCLENLPADAIAIPIDELTALVGAGYVRDPVVVLSLLEMGHDPFVDIRAGDVTTRLTFLDAMTRGSLVQRRLRTYSSIETEQLGSVTYRRLMTLLQHDHGVRIVYPRSEEDRKFFKAAFRVFMADDRNENRALQGLHWSHDAFHFALGNFTPKPPTPDEFSTWYVSGEPLPAEGAHDGEMFETYVKALKRAEDEATFFSFWTLFAEQPSLRQHVKQLTFWEALTVLDIHDRATAWEVYYPVVARAELPERIRVHAQYQAREDIRSLFEYMRGFRDWHMKDILPAWKFASRDMYRGVFTRFEIYEHDLSRYLTRVETFCATLANQPSGLNPMLSACADVQLSLRLRVWDVVKALRLVRAAIGEQPAEVSASERVERRRAFLATASTFLDELGSIHERLLELRARIVDAEMVPRNERIHLEIRTQETAIEQLRGRLWERCEATGWLSAEMLADERGRELPR